MPNTLMSSRMWCLASQTCGLTYTLSYSSAQICCGRYTGSMAGQATVFVSSTVDDFRDVRTELSGWLKDAGYEPCLSEEPSFPVEPGTTSHDACLAGVRACNIFVMLVGCRFGGCYKDQSKSITWREWEEAIDCGLNPIVLVTKDANIISREIARKRGEIQKLYPKKTKSEIDTELLTLFPDDKVNHWHQRPLVQRLVDAVRKGHRDNWVHNNWDGSFQQAKEIIGPSITYLVSAYQKSFFQASARTVQQYSILSAVSFLTKTQSSALAEIKKPGVEPSKCVDAVLRQIEDKRSELFGFCGSDRHNFAIHYRVDATMHPGPVVRHSSIPRFSRKWQIGEGHIGLSVKENALLVAGDLFESDGWVGGDKEESDRSNYQSAVTVPLYAFGDGKSPDATFTITSSRRHHFDGYDQAEVVTATIVGNLLSGIIAAAGKGALW